MAMAGLLFIDKFVGCVNTLGTKMNIEDYMSNTLSYWLVIYLWHTSASKA